MKELFWDRSNIVCDVIYWRREGRGEQIATHPAFVHRRGAPILATNCFLEVFQTARKLSRRRRRRHSVNWVSLQKISVVLLAMCRVWRSSSRLVGRSYLVLLSGLWPPGQTVITENSWRVGGGFWREPRFLGKLGVGVLKTCWIAVVSGSCLSQASGSGVLPASLVFSRSFTQGNLRVLF